MDAIEALKTRRSVRSYKSDPVSREVIADIVDCGRLAASAINIQPWEFVVVTDQTMRSRIADATDHGKHIAEAAVCVAVFCKEGAYYLEDGCAATQNILVAARAHGLGSCWVAGDRKAYTGEIAKLLGAPADYKLVSLIAIGHPVQADEPPKRPLEEVLHWEKF